MSVRHHEFTSSVHLKSEPSYEITGVVKQR
jgi:hypothetical protein